jgi:hypothetical protein
MLRFQQDLREQALAKGAALRARAGATSAPPAGPGGECAGPG